MTKYASGIRPSQLSLVEVEPRGDEAPTIAPAPQATGPDRGSDSRRASGAVASPAPAESSPARNTAVGAAKREYDTERPSRPAHEARGTVSPKVSRFARDEAPPRAAGPIGESSARLQRKHLIWGAGALGLLVVAAGFVGMKAQRELAQPRNLTQPASPAGMSRPPTPANPKTSLAEGGGGTLPEEFVSKFQAIKSSRNWNLIVLYAVEWTRKQPANPEPWKELSMGYYQLRQYGDALDAATKAVEIAPTDSVAWQTLGQINLTVQRAVPALEAFERAAALNDHDVTSLVQAGLLNTQLGRLPDARIAFAKALAVSPEDTDALCGGAALAHKEGRLQDAEAMTRQLKSLNGHCRDPGLAESVRVPANVVARNQSESSTRR